ncbi:MAG: hypothetical protein V2A53_00830 [bacterium]
MNATLPQALIIRVSYYNGTAVPNVPISLAITSQPQGSTGARLSATSVNTNSNG